jgi:hypothetical protein
MQRPVQPLPLLLQALQRQQFPQRVRKVAMLQIMHLVFDLLQWPKAASADSCTVEPSLK